MSLQIYPWQFSFPTWSKTSFDHIRDSSQPPPPGVDFAHTFPVPYQQYNVSTRLPIQSLHSPISSTQLPYATTYISQQSYSYSIISQRTTNDPMPDSYVTFQPDYKRKKLRKRRGKKKKVFAGLVYEQKNQSSDCTINNNDNESKKRKNASDYDEDKCITQVKKEVVQKIYQGKISAKFKAKKQRCDLNISPIFSSLDSQPKNEIFTSVAMKLPLEILVKIVEYSTAETTLALTFTCKKWYNWLTDRKSIYIDQAWRRSRKNTRPHSRKPKTGICEMIYTIQKMKPKPTWYLECNMCYKRSNIMSWKFRNKQVKTCYNCKKMYEEVKK